MKKLMSLCLLAVTFATPALARDTVITLSLGEVLSMPEAKGKLDGSVRFFLDGQKAPQIVETHGEALSNKKTNAAGKTDEFACKWAALSALIALQEQAKKRGANAVVDVVSYYRKKTFKSATDFECHAGNWVVGVALKGTYARVGP